jgi:processing peptidase subunit alpha
MNLESRPIMFEDIGRQVLTYGARTPPEILVQQIDAVTTAELRNVVANMIKTPPSIAVLGDPTAVPRYDLIAQRFG